MESVDVSQLLSLEEIGADRFRHRGRAATGPWTGLFGGQPLALCLRAAGQTVASDRLPHSLHAYFLRPGSSTLDMEIRVDRDTDGRSFSARRVTVRQGDKVIFSMSCSFHVAEEGPDLQERSMPRSVPDPERLPEFDRNPFRRNGEPSVVEVRRVGSRYDSVMPDQAWGRAGGPMPDDPLLHACVLVHFSDLFSGLPPKPGTMDSGGPSLDHAMWFHHPPRMDDWVLMDLYAVAAARGRGLYSGTFHDRTGRLVATVRQEILYSTSRPPRLHPEALAALEKMPKAE